MNGAGGGGGGAITALGWGAAVVEDAADPTFASRGGGRGASVVDDAFAPAALSRGLTEFCNWSETR